MRLRVVGLTLFAAFLCFGLAAGASAASRRSRMQSSRRSGRRASSKGASASRGSSADRRSCGRRSGRRREEEWPTPSRSRSSRPALSAGSWRYQLAYCRSCTASQSRARRRRAPKSRRSGDVRLQQPPEGIVDYAYQRDPGWQARQHAQGQTAADLRALPLPRRAAQGRAGEAARVLPDFKWHAEPHKRLNKFVDTWVIDTTGKGLMKGVWFCYLRSTSGYVIKRTRIRLS